MIRKYGKSEYVSHKKCLKHSNVDPQLMEVEHMVGDFSWMIPDCQTQDNTSSTVVNEILTSDEDLLEKIRDYLSSDSIKQRGITDQPKEEGSGIARTGNVQNNEDSAVLHNHKISQDIDDCDSFVEDGLLDTSCSSQDSLQYEDFSLNPTFDSENMNIDRRELSSELIRRLFDFDDPTLLTEIQEMVECGHKCPKFLKKYLKKSIKARNKFFSSGIENTRRFELLKVMQDIAKSVKSALKLTGNNSENICLDVLTKFSEVLSSWRRDFDAIEAVVAIAKYFLSKYEILEFSSAKIYIYWKLSDSFRKCMLCEDYGILRKATITIAGLIKENARVIKTCSLPTLASLVSAFSLWGPDPTLLDVTVIITNSIIRNLKIIKIIGSENISCLADISVSFSEWLSREHKPSLHWVLNYVTDVINMLNETNQLDLVSADDVTKISVSLSRQYVTEDQAACVKTAMSNIAKCTRRGIKYFTLCKLSYMMLSFSKWVSEYPVRSGFLSIAKVILRNIEFAKYYSLYEMVNIVDACTKCRRADDDERTLLFLVESIAHVLTTIDNENHALCASSPVLLAVLAYSFSRWCDGRADGILRKATLCIATVIIEKNKRGSKEMYGECVAWRLVCSFSKWSLDDEGVFFNATKIIAEQLLHKRHALKVQSICKILFAFSKWRRNNTTLLMATRSVIDSAISEDDKLLGFDLNNITRLVTALTSLRLASACVENLQPVIQILAETCKLTLDSREIAAVEVLPKLAFSFSRWIERPESPNKLHDAIFLIITNCSGSIDKYTVLDLCMLVSSIEKMGFKNPKPIIVELILSVAKQIKRIYIDGKRINHHQSLLSYLAFAFRKWADFDDEEQTLKKSVQYLARAVEIQCSLPTHRSLEPYEMTNFMRAFSKWHQDEGIRSGMSSILKDFERNRVFCDACYSPKVLSSLAEHILIFNNSSYCRVGKMTTLKLAQILEHNLKHGSLYGYDTKCFMYIAMVFSLHKPKIKYDCVLKCTLCIGNILRKIIEENPFYKFDCYFFVLIIYIFKMFSCNALYFYNMKLVNISIVFIANYIRFAIERNILDGCPLNCLSIIGRFLGKWNHLSVSVRKTTKSIIKYVLRKIKKSMSKVRSESLSKIMENCACAIVLSHNYVKLYFIITYLTKIAVVINQWHETNQLEVFPPNSLSYIVFIFRLVCMDVKKGHPIQVCIIRASQTFLDNISRHLSDGHFVRTLSYFASVFSTSRSLIPASCYVDCAMTYIAEIITSQYSENPTRLLPLHNLTRLASSFATFSRLKKVRSAMVVVAESIVKANIQKKNCKTVMNLLEGLASFKNSDIRWDVVNAVQHISQEFINIGEFALVDSIFYPSACLCKIVRHLSVWLEDDVDQKFMKNAIISISKEILERHSFGDHLDTLDVKNLSAGLGNWFEREEREISERVMRFIIRKKVKQIC